MTAEQVAGLTGVDTGCGGITYPAGGWLCPQQLTAELLALAATRGLHVHYGYPVETLSAEGDGWLLNQQRYHQAVVLANGHRITGFAQTAQLPVYPVGGRQPYSPPRGLPPCASAVLRRLPDATESAKSAALHWRQLPPRKTDTTFSEEDQQHNRQRLIDCFPGAEWPQDVDISANDARCGVRCATRDHLPMVGNVPDYAATLTQYASLHEQPDIADSAPVCRNLFMLGALGSRGLCTAPLSAELLAAQMSAEPLPLDSDTGRR
ncbi:FAD-dependent 5-carboxymethylaminomethyl-2-thiouridine(34) oxidoreductase MnmC [Klebsiella pneumoniae]|uniref:FAD-dependent 5-carboxymethylaminomethyl-2-thiouridine(34) oxidoreductase MnmC n=1 Tax=Klebsiella pneumoniae TaxID=573 RepID=A0A939NP39_KLEPN|nr:FAD-dependent 5-carboxymethylaminomethyl-2-thiouridine(34) oxidoreductase MnmC [Klebsiella pneumoniae]